MNRSASRPAQAPPLWLWPVSLALVALFFATTLSDFLDDAVTRREAENHAHRARIAEFGRRRADHPQALHVVSIGDSSLRNATFYNEKMERFSKAIGGPEIRFMRITEANSQLHHILPLFATIFESRPDLLILQSWLLPDRSNSEQRQQYRAYQAGGIPSSSIPRSQHRERLFAGQENLQHQTWIADRVLSKLGDQLGLGAGIRFDEYQRQIYCNPEHRERVLAKRRSDYPPQREFTVDPTAARTVELLIEQAAAVGTTLVFTNLPVATPIAGLPGIRWKAELQRDFFALHAHDPAFEHWRFDEAIADSNFCDWVHLSRRGRRIYAAWFVEQLRRFADARESR